MRNNIQQTAEQMPVPFGCPNLVALWAETFAM
jgi:hypothetical protein